MTRTMLALVILLAGCLLGLSAGCGGSAAEDAAAQSAEPKELPPKEIAIGEYRFRSFDPASNTQTRFDFTLAGLVDHTKEPILQKELKEKEVRIRDRVMIVARESTIEELEDPDLVMFRRRLMKELNRVIEEGQLNDIYVSHYRVRTR